MDFALDDDQAALQQTARQFLRDRGQYIPDHWPQLAALGWTGLLVPEADGGAGKGLLEMMVVLEEMGRVPYAGPFLSSAVLATSAAVRLGLHERLAALADGSARGTVAIDEDGHGEVVARIRTRAVRKAGAWQLTGTKAIVLDADTADFVLVPARTQQGIGTFLIESPAADAPLTLDVSRSISRLVLDGTPAQKAGPDTDHTEIWQRVVDDGAVALAAESLGAMEASFDLAVEYAKVRVQFDRPIATFQATKHKAADMLERIELSRVGIHHAAWASDVEDPVRAEAAAMAKSFTGRASNEVTGEAIQIHGGVGFTWDCDAHRYYRRAKANDLFLGYHGIWRRRVEDSYLGAR